MKSIPYFIVGLLLISSFTTIGFSKEAGDNQDTISMSFSNINIIDSNIEPYIELNLNGAEGRLYQTSAPILPIYTKEIILPFGTKILNIQSQIGQVQSMVLSNKIVPAPTPVIPDIDDTTTPEYIMDESIYNSNELFPNNWFDYYTGAGLDDNSDHKTFLILRVFPIRYSPNTDTIDYIQSIDLTITYQEPTANPFPTNTEYNLAIIAPAKFSSQLQKLITHKNSMGISTMLKTTEDIYSQYTGVDNPEKIKYFIKDAIETYNIKYALLVGGLKSYFSGNPRDDRNQGSKDWYIPVRYTNLKEAGSIYDPGFISDLYYADIYKSDGNFSSWDSNNDGIFAKWEGGLGKDVIDFYPDVYVGRLACRNTQEVKIMVNKIINYEKGAYGTSWYDKIIFAAGDSHDDPPTNYKEGEVACDKVYTDFMSEFTAVKLYASNKDSNPDLVPTRTNIKREINKGAGHIYFDGHANPTSWITHYPGEFDGWIPNGGIKIYDFPYLFNGGKLPVVNVQGCHNSQFNVTILSCLQDKDNSKHTWCYGQFVPECWSWWLARKIGGGSIATIGNSGLGYGTVGEHGDLDGNGVNEPDCVEALGGYFFINFYKAFDQGYDMLGETWGMAMKNYLDTFPGMGDQADAKTVEELPLLGDPSLKVGGYPSNDELKAEIVDGAAGVIGAPSESVMFQATAYNGQEPYTYSWDFDNDNVYDDATGEVTSWIWNLPGVYSISLKVTDNNGNSEIYDTIVGIEYGASTPSKPMGETKIKSGETYTYTTDINTQDNYWNHIYYKFSWGDGIETEWIESSEATHSWSIKGVYQVKVKALLTHESGNPDDAENAKETDWSDPLTISLSKTREITAGPILQLLQYIFNQYPNAFPILKQLLGI
jgi:hypothetical protein